MSERFLKNAASPGTGWRTWHMRELPHHSVENASLPQAGNTMPGEFTSESNQTDQDRIYADALATGYRQGQEAGYAAGLEQGLQQGRSEGIREGLEQGKQQAAAAWQAHTRDTLSPLPRLMEELNEAYAQFNDEMANSIVRLALSVGRQLAGEALSANPKQVLEIVRELLRSEPAFSDPPKLWLHPGDLQLVGEYLAADIAAAGWQLQADDSLSRGGCRLVSTSGDIDASVEMRWQAICKQLRQNGRGRKHRNQDRQAPSP